jgi:tRNA(Ile2) C34 agmatinyltransferase TiaS
MKMIEGFDAHCDAMGIIPSKEVICGKCNKRMKEIAPKKYRCPKCGTLFEDVIGEKQNAR